jgi:uncharacterized protein (DUF4213/DUF364 family)
VSLAAALAASVEGGEETLVVKRAEVGPRFFGIGVAAPAKETLAATGVAFLGPHQRRGEAAVQTEIAASQGQSAQMVARWLNEGESLERTAIGAAAVNALLALQRLSDGTPLGEENGLDVLAREAVGKSLAVVGRFPYLDEIRAKATRSWVLELEPEGDEVGPGGAAEVLGEAEVVGITGSTIANGTLEGLLEKCRRDAFVVLIGPSTPLSPVLFDYKVGAMCGVLAEDPEGVLSSIVNEGSTRRIPGTRAVSLRRR